MEIDVQTPVDPTLMEGYDDNDDNDENDGDSVDRDRASDAAECDTPVDFSHQFIIRYNEKDLKIKVDEETAHRLQNDHTYAESFVTSLINANSSKKSQQKQASVASNAKESLVPAKTKENKDFWGAEDSLLLINARFNMEEVFQNSNSSKRHLWTKVAAEVNKMSTSEEKVTWQTCHRKFRSMQTTYRNVLRNVKATNKRPSWMFYDAFFDAYGGSPIQNISGSSASANKDLSVEPKKKKYWTDSDTWVLVNKRIAMNDAFLNCTLDDWRLWEVVAKAVNMSPKKGPYTTESCRTKWLFLLVQYRNRLSEDITEAERALWPFFDTFHKTFKGCVPDKDAVDKREKAGSIGWGSRVTECLLNTRIKMEEQFKNSHLRRSQLWDKVAATVNELEKVNLTGGECLARFRTALRTYKSNLERLETKGHTPTWKFFNIMHSTFKGRNISLRPWEPRESTAVKHIWGERSVKMLIKFRLELENEFVRQKLRLETLWFYIAKKMNSTLKSKLYTWIICHRQWIRLRSEYDGIIEQQNITGELDSNWPYFDLLHETYNGQTHHAALDSANHRAMMVAAIKEPDRGIAVDNCYEAVQRADDNTGPATSTSMAATTPKSSRPTVAAKSVRRPLSKVATSTPRNSEVFHYGHTHTESEDNEQKKKSVRIDESEACSFERGHSRCAKRKSKHKTKGWFRYMLADWKKERMDRWNEKKQLEREKIEAIKKLANAILSLDPDAITDVEQFVQHKRSRLD